MEVKGLAWIGNIYDKFEAMCLEMEEVMYEDTVKYVENQVQTVGSTVKRFYSDVMQDLHPESYNDPIKGAAADLSLNPYAHSERKLKASSKKDGRETDWKLNDEAKVISGKANLGVYRRPTATRRGSSKGILDPLPSSLIDPVLETKNKLSTFSQMKSGREVAHGVTPSVSFKGLSKDRSGNSKSVADTVFPNPAPTGSAPRTEKKQADPKSTRVSTLDTAATLRLASSAGLQKPDSPGTLEKKQADPKSTRVGTLDTAATPKLATSVGLKKTDFPGMLGSTTTGLKKADYAAKSLDTSTVPLAAETELKKDDCAGALLLESSGNHSQTKGETVDNSLDVKSSGRDGILVHQERLDGCSEGPVKNNDGFDADVELVEPYNDSTLAESCVIVEGDEPRLTSQGKVCRKSYKKKLREAFSSKKRLTRKEYKDLATKYTVEESNQGSAAKTVEPDDLLIDDGVEMLPGHDSESDWELL